MAYGAIGWGFESLQAYFFHHFTLLPDCRMTRRSRAREVALQLLYQRDHNPDVARPVIERFAQERLREPSLKDFCLALLDGVVKNQEDIDRRLSEAADNWRLSRMAAVDRNILRMGAFELLFTQETPAPVAFDEVIELARRYGSMDSSAFVNGVLDRLRREANPAPASTEEPTPTP
jgi:N utilization substance protein B